MKTSKEDTVSDALARLSAQGVSIWLDDLSRERLTAKTGTCEH